jgi:YfiH family protein
MTFRQSGSVRFFVFDLFEDEGVVNAVITRRGGTSPEPWSSLNVGGTVGDDPERVVDNRKRTFEALDKPVSSLFDVWQVHGTDVVCTDSPRSFAEAHKKADAILTDRPEVTLFMRFADCVPIFLYDPVRKVVGLVHAGWQGTVKRVVSHTIETMCEEYNSKPGDILAGIGPSIGPDHYEIGEDVSLHVRNAFGDVSSQFLQSCNGGDGVLRVKFDLWGANHFLLQEAGVREIEVSKICTSCNLGDWYSHRAEKGRTGRFGAAIALQ